DGRDDGGSGRDPGRTANANAAGLGSIVLLALLTGAGGTAGQGGGLPALRDLGLSYISPSGFLQVELSGRLDLEGYLPQDEPAWIIPAT
ncbi:MAG: hypothetical protein GWN71_04920, partial [Gammaproteobacteria bacterium]|nr:hypothetical protein [Gemmatimonadota bacterium]NIU72936.1 hypothetical protein [Gammaproteobacteria bacterium]NIX19147.1 hypothetical protein [Actinomycetota bacterium]